MCRRVGREIPPEIYVLEKIANRDWFVLPVERNSESAVLEGSDTLSCTALGASGSANAVVRSIERAGRAGIDREWRNRGRNHRCNVLC